MLTDHHEHREYERTPLSGPVRYWDWDRVQQGQASEISGSGIFLKTRELLPEGAHVTLRLELPGQHRGMTVLGRVVRTVHGGLLAAAGMGIRFLDLSPSQRQLIQTFVESRSAA